MKTSALCCRCFFSQYDAMTCRWANHYVLGFFGLACKFYCIPKGLSMAIDHAAARPCAAGNVWNAKMHGIACCSASYKRATCYSKR